MTERSARIARRDAEPRPKCTPLVNVANVTLARMLRPGYDPPPPFVSRDHFSEQSCSLRNRFSLSGTKANDLPSSRRIEADNRGCRPRENAMRKPARWASVQLARKIDSSVPSAPLEPRRSGVFRLLRPEDELSEAELF